jgi:citrate lyase beta subunit
MIQNLSHLPCILFVPGHKPHIFDKAMASSAPAIVIDLEDAVSPEQKNEARSQVKKWLSENSGRGKPVGVRFNHPATRYGLQDMALFFNEESNPDFIILPKVEHAVEVQLIDRLSGGIPLICIIESALGLMRAYEIATATPRVCALGFGGADLAADLRVAFEWDSLAFARSSFIQAAAAAGVGAMDVPWLALDDLEGLEQEVRRAKSFGFTGKFSIHPRLVERTIAAFLPTKNESEHAKALLEAFESSGSNVSVYQGKMVDEALLRSARRIVALEKFWRRDI